MQLRTHELVVLPHFSMFENLTDDKSNYTYDGDDPFEFGGLTKNLELFLHDNFLSVYYSPGYLCEKKEPCVNRVLSENRPYSLEAR